MTTRPYLALVSLALAAYFGRSGALSTGASGNETSLNADPLEARKYYAAYGDADAQVAEQQFDEARSGNGTAQELARRDVWSPKITSPDSTAVWVAGTTVEITWLV